MARNSLFIRSPEAAVGSVGQYEVFGTTGSETLFLAGDADVVLDASFNRGGDTILIDGSADTYSARLQNANLILTSEAGAYILIPVGTVGTTIRFAGSDSPDVRELVIASGSIRLGGQVIAAAGTTPILGEDALPPPTDPETGESFRLSGAPDDLVGTAGDDRFEALSIDSRGTLGDNDRIAGGLGNDALVASIHSGGDSPLAPTISGIETLDFTALSAPGVSGAIARIEGRNIFDVERIASTGSDASLVFSRVNTRTSAGESRATEVVQVRMAETQGRQGDRAASDLAVLFDRTSLVSETPAPNGKVASHIELEDVGRSADGGHLVIGAGDSNAAGIGVARFEIDVAGGASQSSSLASLSSTNNALSYVAISSAAHLTGQVGTANLTIGNSATIASAVSNLASLVIGSVPNAAGASACDLTDARNSALTDVIVMDAADFKGDFELHATISEDIGAKLFVGGATEGPGNPAGTIRYLFGSGDDVLNLNVAQAALRNNAVDGDFKFEATLGAGNDRALIQAGDGAFAPSELSATPIASWYGGHLVSENLVLDTGAGDDLVCIYGASAALIDTGTGADTIFADNSGTNDALANCGYAVWVYNARNLDIANLSSEAALSVSQIANLSVKVSYLGFTASAVVAASLGSIDGVTVTDLDVNAAILAAINEDPVLGTLLRVEQGAGRTLTVLSQVDGAYVEGDLAISLFSAPLTEAQAAGSARQLDAAQVAAFSARYDSQFAEQGSVVLAGRNSQNLNSNRIEAGAGDDLVVLSSNVSSIETLRVTGAFGTDHVVNFSAHVETNAMNETQVFFIDQAPEGQGSVASVTYALFGLESRTVAISDGATAAQIAQALASDINARYPDLASASVESAGTEASNLTVTANGPSGQGIDFPITTIVLNGMAGTGDVLPVTVVLGDIDDGHRGALGYDILDFNAFLGGAPEYFANGAQSDGQEVTELSAFVDSRESGIVLINTLYLPGDDDDASGLLPGSFGDAPATADRTAALEEARLQTLVTALDDAATPGNAGGGDQRGIIITVSDGEGAVADSVPGSSANVYQYVNGKAAGDAQVTYLGTLILGESLAEAKDAVGNWDAMTIENFTPLTASQLLETYMAGLVG